MISLVKTLLSDAVGASLGEQFASYYVPANQAPASDALVLRGTQANDKLTGSGADETLIGAGGADRLTGGDGHDTFRYEAVTDSYRTASTSQADLITDFNPSQDQLDLSALGYSGFGSGLDGTLQLVYNASLDRTYLKDRQADANGNRFEIALQGNLVGSLNADNVLFVPVVPANHAPVLDQPLSDADAREQVAFTYQIPESAFSDPDGDGLTYSASLADGSALPEWLAFDPVTRTFSGTPSGEAAGNYSLLVNATDALGASVSDVFQISVADTPSGAIVGTTGQDTLVGTDGSELLLGLGDNDTLKGGAGDDTLDGGAGRDNLYGGSGADTFTFSALGDSYRDYSTGGITATDTIQDFTPGQDKIDVSALGFTGLGDGQNHTLYLTLNDDGSKTYIKSASADPSGQRFEVALAGNLLGQLSASDFVFAERDAQPILYLPTLGQSNARLMRMTEDDDQSGISEMVKDLARYTGYDVRSQFKDADGNDIDIAIGGSTVSGYSTASAEDQALTWWYADTNQPGPLLLRAVGLLKEQLASLTAIDQVTMGIVWGQGEQGAQEIARADDPVAAAAQYKADTLKVFDYLHQQLGDFDIYLMETGRYQAEAASARGYTEDKIQSIEAGVAAVREAQQQMAAERGDVHLAVDYSDLPLRYEVDPTTYPDDVWHLHEESDEIVGQRLADYIANHMGFQGNPDDNNSVQAIFDEAASHQGHYIHGTDEDDSLVGTDQNDTLDGDLGADHMEGKDGNDTYIVDNAGDTVVETNPDDKQIDTVKSSVSWVLGDNLEHLELTGVSAINGTGNALRNFIIGNANDNVIDGGAGADSMTGGNGSDIYYVDDIDDAVIETNADSATGGIDTVYSRLAAYTLAANTEILVIDSDTAANGTGNTLDNLIVAGSGDNLIDGRTGNDTLSYALAHSGITLSLATTKAQATGGSGTDSIKNMENLIGSQYDDTLTGNSGNNVLEGGAGNDALIGGGGDDRLVGGAGTDTLTGGSGADTYVFTSLADMGCGSARDQIVGFKSAEHDQIDLTALGNFTFIGSQAFDADATHQLRFENGVLYGSTNADGAAEFEIQLTGVKALSASDFTS
ncbi:Hemolysin-type calcium-binding repeat-containing protein [Pseudomonas sp. URIL14HWK12:I9]|nr:hemolysin type calcium-binding protein [Pseudomonas sp. URIL14HWK12:I12]PVZ22915.1 hemolysin type calcium-binding protein [Pseudomonas sp. URIL14HWK12:I10]PVZ37455.1 hemolysin type calcium-binding protein [Pseudomonas sp. URIL14HWK12:I11]SNZ14835.1 Hemolysin-type calcium-binding repeat-containing protein [Pseudomonas sp. URIL14HWK12:I9]